MPLTKSDTRERFLAMLADGVPERQAREECGIARSTSYRWRYPEQDRKLAKAAASSGECPTCGGPMRKSAAMCRWCSNGGVRRMEFIEQYNAGTGSLALAIRFGLKDPNAAYQWARTLRRRGFPIERR